MKKIFTLFLAVGIVTLAQAQTGSRDNRDSRQPGQHTQQSDPRAQQPDVRNQQPDQRDYQNRNDNGKGWGDRYFDISSTIPV